MRLHFSHSKRQLELAHQERLKLSKILVASQDHEEPEVFYCNTSTLKIYVECCTNKNVQFSLDEGVIDDMGSSHYSRDHWAKATIETLVKMEDFIDLVIAPIDHGSKVNIMSKKIYKCKRWPINMEHGRMI